MRTLMLAILLSLSGCVSWQDIADTGIMGAGWKSSPPASAVQPHPVVVQEPPHTPPPLPVQPPVHEPQPAAAKPYDAIAWVGYGETRVVVGTEHEGKTATIEGSISGVATVSRGFAVFAGNAEINDLVRCAPLVLRVALIRSTEVQP